MDCYCEEAAMCEVQSHQLTNSNLVHSLGHLQKSNGGFLTREFTDIIRIFSL